MAALDLYAERGFERTTAADVAERAGVTERTFFRHFADKREVLFDGADALEAHLVQHIESAPADLSPLDAVACAMEEFGRILDERGDFPRRRAAVVSANPSLQERELLKLASLASASADALVRRGVAALVAALAAESGVTVFKVGFETWISDDPSTALADHVRAALVELKALTTAA
jgi:AcrR family transcriptional regulator